MPAFNRSKSVFCLSLVALLGLGGSFWLVKEAISPQIARAYTAQVNVSIPREPGETFEPFLRRAEAVARAATQRSFDRDILITEVAVMIVGEFNGSAAPILSVNVSRQQWRSRPDAQRWATYYPSARALLGLDQLVAGDEPLIQPSVTTPTTTTPPAVTPPAPPAQPIPPSIQPAPPSIQPTPIPGTPQERKAPTNPPGPR